MLERIYEEVKDVILSRQHPVTGLFPASTSINVHGDYTDAWVRDNVYTIMGVWATGTSCKNAGLNVAADELLQSTVKLMRGLLQCMMRQSSKVERFKHTSDPSDALHAKYNTATGLQVVADDAWGHLQLDATSLYLLMLAQMTAGGLRIILTQDEVNFVQNLIYYISRTSRTPDFGIWERGNKINNGKTEVNASSVGMAKAAMQALDGLNLFGPDGPASAVVFTMADAVARARTTLAALLPRESRSKECDGALLSVIGYPAFAVGDENLVNITLNEVLSKLAGNYGCKRFLLDGHQTALEDRHRAYYEHSELINFQNIESEWPLFYTYLFINSFFDGDKKQAKSYRSKLEKLMVERNGRLLLPELYYVPQENIQAEKQQPGTQERVPNENIPLVWAQSLFIVGKLLDNDLLACRDLDPLLLKERQATKNEATIALVILSQNASIKQRLAKAGVISQTLEDIQPLQVVSASNLVEVYHRLGANEALSLSGRPCRALQSLATSHPYNVNDNELLCLSWLQHGKLDYRHSDAKLMGEYIQAEIKHIRKHWFHKEPAVFTILIDDSTCKIPQVQDLFKTLKDLQHQNMSDHVSHATAQLAYRSARVKKMRINGDVSLQAFTDVVNQDNINLPELVRLLKTSSVNDSYASKLLSILISLESSSQQKIEALDKWGRVYALDKEWVISKKLTIRSEQIIAAVYHHVQRQQQWVFTRYCFDALKQPPVDLGETLAELMVRRLTVAIGHMKGSERHIETAFTTEELVALINDVYTSPLERTLMMELLLILGSLIRTEPEVFEGLRRIRLYDVLVMAANCHEDAIFKVLAELTPSELYQRIRDILSEQHKVFSQGVAASFYSKDEDRIHHVFQWGRATSPQGLGTDWFEWRVKRGLITRLDTVFLQAIWESLKHVDHIVFGESGQREAELDCQLTLKSMTPGEETFALLIEKIVHLQHPAYYRCLVIEALFAFTEYCVKNPNSYLKNSLILADIIELAASAYAQDIDQPVIQLVNNKETIFELEYRCVDLLLQASPKTVQKYFTQIFREQPKQSLEGEQKMAEGGA